MSFVTSLIGAGSSLSSGLRQKQSDEDTARQQGEIGAYQSADAMQRGTAEEMRYRRSIGKLLGAQKNEIGARNVERRGSALDLLEDSAMIGEEDAVNIRNDAARQAWGYRVNANEQARITNQAGTNARNAGVGSALTSGAQAYGRYVESK